MGYGLRIDFSVSEVPFYDDSVAVETIYATLNNTSTGVLYGILGFGFFVFSGIHLFRKHYVRKPALRSRFPAGIKFGRWLRKFLMHKGYFGLPTRIHTFVAVFYSFINLWVCSFSAQSGLGLIQLARKCGWFSVINGTLLIFLAMKNTPLASLTGLSYEKLNVFHRWVAIIALLEGSVHTIAVAVGLSRLIPSQVGFLLIPENVWGIVCLALWIMIPASFYILKRIQYEVFYIMHLILFPLTFIAAILHNHHSYIPIGIAFGLYFIDRVIRYNRMYWHNRYADKLKATITLTKDQMTIVKVPRGNLMWTPGTHAFLNIPGIRYFESHPFSIASVGDDIDTEGGKKTVDFIIKPEDGFTKAMKWQAEMIANGEKQTRELKAYVDGPYGALPNFNVYNKVLLYASGSGITFTLPIALSIVRKAKVRHLEFIWSTKKAMSYDNIRPQLEELARGGQGGADDQNTYVVIRLHETDPDKKGIRRAQTMMQKMRGLHLGGGAPGAMSRAMTGAMSKMTRGRAHRREDSTDFNDQSPLVPPVPPVPSQHSGTVNTPRTSRGDSMSSEYNAPGAPLNSPPTGEPIKIHRNSGFFRAPSAQDYQAADDDDYQDIYEKHHGDSDNDSAHSHDNSDEETDDDDPAHFHARSRGMDPFSEKSSGAGDALEKFIREGRPNMKSIIENFVNEAGSNETCAIGSCGPGSEGIRAGSIAMMKSNGPSVSLFVEEFGW